MNYIYAIFLSGVQSITEFFPISSSGHLILIRNFFSFDAIGIELEVVLHLGTLFAIFFYYKKDIFEILNKIFKKDLHAIELALKIGMTTIPIIIFVLVTDIQNYILEKKIINLLPITFFSMSVILFITKYISSNHSNDSSLITLNKSIRYKDVVFIGISQVFAIFPGISRSGITIAMMMLLGMKKNNAAKISFLMAIPILLGASIIELPSILSNRDNYYFLFISFIFSIIFGILCINFVLKILYKGRFWYFSIYCLMMSVVSLYLL